MPFVLDVPHRLREKLGDEASEDLLILLDRYGEQFQMTQEHEAEKCELRLGGKLEELRGELQVDIYELEKRMGARIDGLEKGLRAEMGEMEKGLRAEMGEMEKRLWNEMAATRVQIEKSKADTIRWMFIFWIGNIATLVGIFKLLLIR